MPMEALYLYTIILEIKSYIKPSSTHQYYHRSSIRITLQY